MGLVHAEGTVSLHDFAESGFENVPESVFRKGVMVAGIYIPVGFHRGAVTAERIVDAQVSRFSQHISRGDLEDLDKFLPEVTLLPSVKYTGEKSAVPLRRN